MTDLTYSAGAVVDFATFAARRKAIQTDATSEAVEPAETQPMFPDWGAPEPKRLDARAVEHRRRMLRHLNASR